MTSNAPINGRRVALITGASRGIGAAIAERFAAAGWDLTISARTIAALDELSVTLSRSHGVRVETVSADMAEADAVENLARVHTERYGRLDALILNAGLGFSGAIGEFALRRLDKLYQVNTRAPYSLIQQLLPTLRATAAHTTTAKVIAVASITGIYPEAGLSGYGATKAAVVSLCETLNLEESANGVSATTISPGYVDTDMSEWTKDLIPGHEMIRASDVATMAMAVTELSRWAVLPNLVLTRPGPQIWRA